MKDFWKEYRKEADACPNCQKARRLVKTAGFTVSDVPSHGRRFCDAQSVETFGPALYCRPKDYVRIYADGEAYRDNTPVKEQG